jgi:hypothetical protein
LEREYSRCKDEQPETDAEEMSLILGLASLANGARQGLVLPLGLPVVNLKLRYVRLSQTFPVTNSLLQMSVADPSTTK